MERACLLRKHTALLFACPLPDQSFPIAEMIRIRRLVGASIMHARIRKLSLPRFEIHPSVAHSLLSKLPQSVAERFT